MVGMRSSENALASPSNSLRIRKIFNENVVVTSSVNCVWMSVAREYLKSTTLFEFALISVNTVADLEVESYRGLDP
jgi:hypothetical protein